MNYSMRNMIALMILCQEHGGMEENRMKKILTGTVIVVFVIAVVKLVFDIMNIDDILCDNNEEDDIEYCD